jgi:pristinamycin I synthase-3/4
MLVGILAILKAGGAYVPLDPALPLERLQFMSTDADLRLILTQAHLIPKLSSLPTELLCVDNAQATTDKVDLENPSPIASPDNLAYIIYTSGSTGSPKGVLIDHRGVVSYFSCFSSVFGLRNDDVVLQLASFAFDMSIRDLICPVTIGAHIILVSNAEVRDPFLLVKKIDRHRVTAFGSTPSLLSPIIDAIERTDSDHRSLRHIFSGGEALPTDLAQRILDTFGGRVHLSNEYGPTECTMTSAHYEVTDIQPCYPIVPLGRPLPNVELYILDRHLRPLPIGIPGEIHIGGIGLARGYLNWPDLTAERFISNPFEPGKRLYKTGDLGRRLPSGDLEFLGRLDRQTKIRGYRIELGEIETALTSLSEVSQAIVDVSEPTPDDKRIVAYVIPATSEPPSSDTLKAKLHARLPEYMIPNAFIILDRFPLTSRGKIDRSTADSSGETDRSCMGRCPQGRPGWHP